MLDVSDHPQNARQLIEDGRTALNGRVWDRSEVDPILNAIANSLADSGQGEYHRDHVKPETNISEKPVVEYCPALILRKRSMRGLELLLEKMKEQIEAGGLIPREFLDLCESLGESQGIELELEGDGELDKEREIYFPLLSNEEQRRIILTLNRQNGVLVQGPPGTGKSHTIANLICHFLATGKRVLVTAKTHRALQVLHDKLPEEIKPLCINLLGSSTEERESLEKSVAGILMKLDRRDEIHSKLRIRQLEQDIKANREAKAETDNKLRALRESETYKHTIADGAYSGTAAEIARIIGREETELGWFQDQIPEKTALPVSNEEISRVCDCLVQLTPEEENQLSQFIPDPDTDLKSGELIRALFKKEKTVSELVTARAEQMKTPEGHALSQMDKETLSKLISDLSELGAAVKSTMKAQSPWVAEAVHDVLNDRSLAWTELLRLSKSHSSDLRRSAEIADTYELLIPDGMDRKRLCHDAKALKSHFETGGGKGFWFLKPKTIREHGTLIRSVKVNGRDCKELETVQELIDYLTVEQGLEYIWSLWAGKVQHKNGPFPFQVAEIDELLTSLEKIIQLHGLKEKVLQHFNNLNDFSSSVLEDYRSLYDLMETCQAFSTQIDLSQIERFTNKLQVNLSTMAARKDAHPIARRICQAFVGRNADLYCDLIDQTRELRRNASSVIEKRDAVRRLAEVAPKLARTLANCSEPLQWAGCLKSLEKAWAWARAKSWLTEYLTADSESLERHSRRLDDDIRKNLAELAAVKAWDFCISRMQESHRRHLMGWQQAMKKLGKGTGKHAYTHRRNAQQHLNECRDAVPAWVMPLHRVYETVDAGAGIFDIVVVDEASQCGPEALPLLYLGKRVLVVGDDKQISPEAVGVDRSQIQRLMRDYLFDFQHADSFDVESSLFDHGRIRFSNRITLREHFRCMPEIIHFSNDLCYRTDPLIPLRQYPPDRLEPIKFVHVSSGYREGHLQRVINRPEAEALVETVVKCCKDERYQGMTMGVIVLQGDSQAYLIGEMLLKHLGAEEMEQRRLICGNPYSFQGDERDVIFLSIVAAPNERIGPMTQAADQRRFNVAASRAQEQMWLFHSVTINELSEQCLRRRLIEYFHYPKSRIAQALGADAEGLRRRAFQANRLVEKPPTPFDSWFEVDVALDIAANGYRVVPQFQFADKRIDLVVQGTKAQLAVECDGDFWHGAEEYAADMERQRKLERCNWHFFRIRESSYYAAREKSLEPLWVQLERMGITTENGFEDVESDGGEPVSDKTGLDEQECAADPFDEDVEESPESVEGAEDSISSSSGEQEGVPSTIQDALRVKSDFMGKVIVEILHERPNCSCVRESMSTYILKHWNIRTRSQPRKQFAQKVDDLIAVMSRKGYLTIYKSKNVRIRLGWQPYPGFENRDQG